MDIAAFIRAEAARPFCWGTTDCARTADRWVLAATGRSPMAVFGRVHGGQRDAEDWLAEPGGIAVATNRIMRSAGFARTRSPVAGDVGLVVHKGKLCMAIHAGRCWFSRDETGLIGAPLSACWKAWRVRQG